MGRKRQKKEIVDKEDNKRSKTSKFNCSECEEGFETERVANDHIIKRHYGLARINDEMKTPFNESEIIKCLIKAQKVVKVLKCKNIGCDKQFRSGLGLKMHWDLCGKSESELTTNCEICGKQLKISSVSYHMKNHSLANKAVGSEESETDVESNENNDEKTPRKRASAIRAQKTIRKSTKGETIISGSLNHESDSDYETTETPNECQTQSQYVLSNKNSEQNCKKILSVWRELIASNKDFLREVPKPDNWANDVLAFGKVICPFDGCDQEFTTRDGLKYHYQRCGINFKFTWKCKMCGFEAIKGNKTIILHLWSQHKDSLPELPQELNDCVQQIETSSTDTLIQRTTKDVKQLDLTKCVTQFHERCYKQKSFPSLAQNITSWLQVPEDELNYYIPFPIPSVQFWSTKSTENSWKKLNLFESQLTGSHISFFVGGPVWSCAWCPIPMDAIDCDQYIAIASNMNWETTHTLNDTDIEGGLIQIWKVGKLDNQFNPSVEPKLALSIAHSCGMVWDMEWCPGGTTWDNPLSSNDEECDKKVLPRLGLLAIACGDGYIRVHSIPFPHSLDSHKSIHYYNEPMIILNPPGIGNSVNNENTVCKCLSWIKSNGQHLIVGGYGSGVAAVWDLTTTCSLLIVEQNESQTILRPVNSWMAHNAAINRIKWLSNSSDQFLVSCGFDRSAKLWNLKDLTVPINTVKKGLFTAVDTHMKWNGMFLASDDCYHGFQNNTVFKDFGFFNFGSNSVTSHKTCVWDIAVSEWMSAAVCVDAGGEAVIFQNFQLKSEPKRKPFDRIPLYHISVHPISLNPSSKVIKTKKSNKSKDNPFDLVIHSSEPPVRTYTDFSTKFGLVFNDYDLTNLKAIPTDELNRIRLSTHMQYQRLSDYPLISINRVSWNPNFTSCAWILTGSQSGICRLSCVPSIRPNM